MRERRKEPREGSETDPETACIQTVGAPASWAFGSFEERSESKDFQHEIDFKIVHVAVMPNEVVFGSLLVSGATQKSYEVETDPDRAPSNVTSWVWILMSSKAKVASGCAQRKPVGAAA